MDTKVYRKFVLHIFMLVLVSLLLAAASAADGARWPECPAGARAACAAGTPHVAAERLTRDYVVDGRRLTLSLWSHDDGQVQAWRCWSGAPLGGAAPAFPAPRRAALVHLRGCGPPPGRSYSDLLRQLKVFTTRLSITPPLARSFDAHLITMTLSELSIHSERLAKLENDFSNFDDTLERLSLKKISMTTDQFMSLRNVVSLSLIETGLEEIPDLTLFSRLEHLSVRESRLLDARRLAAAPALRTLVLEAPDAALAAMPRLERATFINAYAMEPIFGNCSELESLSVERGSLRAVRAGWLAGCARLRRLDLHGNVLEALPSGNTTLLTDAGALTYLDLSNNMLRALPGDLLKRSENLTHLNVSHNLLTTVPDDLVVHTSQLLHLDLSHNRLTAVPGTLLNGPLRLKRLDLSHNRLTELPESFRFPAIANANALYLDLSHNKLSQLLNVSSTKMEIFKGINLSHQLKIRH